MDNFWVCTSCGEVVKADDNGLPASKYWKGRDMSAVYCGAECSLEDYASDD